MCAATLLFEGTKEVVDRQEKFIYNLASQYNGIKAGPDNGIRGYFLTYVIAYLRDFGQNHHFMAESFETAVPWDKMTNMIEKVNKRIMDSCRQRGVNSHIFCSSRVTQVYETGACVYLYFGFNYKEMDDPIEVYEGVENDAREEILNCGGSLSHHHGVGKIRKAFLE